MGPTFDSPSYEPGSRLDSFGSRHWRARTEDPPRKGALFVRRPSNSVLNPPASRAGELPASLHGRGTVKWTLTAAVPSSTPAPLILCPASSQPSPPQTPLEVVPQPVFFVRGSQAPPPSQQLPHSTLLEAATHPVYVVGGSQAPPPSTFVLVPARAQRPLLGPLYLSQPLRQ